MRFASASLLLLLLAADLASGQSPQASGKNRQGVRFATFNVSLSRDKAGQLIRELQSPRRKQPQRVAEIIQRVRPDVLLMNEFDYDGGGEALQLFRRNYLAVGQNGQRSIKYAYSYRAAVNTGVPTGQDLDRDGKSDGPADCYGFGKFPGHYGMAVLSRYPIEARRVRTFQRFLWRDMPNARRPVDPNTKMFFQKDSVWATLRLSSKSHWDLPIKTPAGIVHFLVAHPTPPVFDGPEDRNGCRNHDEIRFWADYVSPARSAYIYDDRAGKGGLAAGAKFVIAGDMNADPVDGDSLAGAVKQLTGHPLIDDRHPPRSDGAREAAASQGGANEKHQGDPSQDTGDFNDRAVGNLRLDYVLPSRTLRVVAGGVFWPRADSTESVLSRASDHHLVWMEVSE